MIAYLFYYQRNTAGINQTVLPIIYIWKKKSSLSGHANILTNQGPFYNDMGPYDHYQTMFEAIRQQ